MYNKLIQYRPQVLMNCMGNIVRFFSVVLPVLGHVYRVTESTIEKIVNKNV